MSGFATPRSLGWECSVFDSGLNDPDGLELLRVATGTRRKVDWVNRLGATVSDRSGEVMFTDVNTIALPTPAAPRAFGAKVSPSGPTQGNCFVATRGRLSRGGASDQRRMGSSCALSRLPFASAAQRPWPSFHPLVRGLLVSRRAGLTLCQGLK